MTRMCRLATAIIYAVTAVDQGGHESAKVERGGRDGSKSLKNNCLVQEISAMKYCHFLLNDQTHYGAVEERKRRTLDYWSCAGAGGGSARSGWLWDRLWRGVLNSNRCR